MNAAPACGRGQISDINQWRDKRRVRYYFEKGISRPACTSVTCCIFSCGFLFLFCLLAFFSLSHHPSVRRHRPLLLVSFFSLRSLCRLSCLVLGLAAGFTTQRPTRPVPPPRLSPSSERASGFPPRALSAAAAERGWEEAGPTAPRPAAVVPAMPALGLTREEARRRAGAVTLSLRAGRRWYVGERAGAGGGGGVRGRVGGCRHGGRNTDLLLTNSTDNVEKKS